MSIILPYIITYRVVVDDAKCIVVNTGHARLSVCVSVCGRVATLLHVSWGNGWVSLVVQCWTNLRSVHGFRCYNNTAPSGFAVGAHNSVTANAKRQRVLVLAVCLVFALLLMAVTQH